jgi:hypothetical protein
MGAAVIAINGIIEILVTLGAGIRTVKTLSDELKEIWPAYEGMSDEELVSKYETKLGITRAELLARLNNVTE